MTIEAVIFYLLLIDSVSYMLVVLFGDKWYTKHFHVFSRFFPPAKGWGVYYLVLVLWIGSLLFRMGALG